MQLRFGARVMGKDGTYAKIMAMDGDQVTVQRGLMGARETLTRDALEAWAADDTPGRPEASDYDNAPPEIVVGAPEMREIAR